MSRKNGGSYDQWSWDPKHDKVVRCGFRCDKQHDHFTGLYEDALRWFGGDVDSTAHQNRHWGNLMNLIIHHQCGDGCITKTSYELYQTLMQAAGSPKYWVSPAERQEKVLQTLRDADDSRMIHDGALLATWKRKQSWGTLSASERKRMVMLKRFQEDHDFYSSDCGVEVPS